MCVINVCHNSQLNLQPSNLTFVTLLRLFNRSQLQQTKSASSLSSLSQLLMKDLETQLQVKHAGVINNWLKEHNDDAEYSLWQIIITIITVIIIKV